MCVCVCVCVHVCVAIGEVVGDGKRGRVGEGDGLCGSG